MRQPKILSVVIACFLLTAIFSGCSGSKSVGVVRTVFSERLIAEISSPYTGSPLIYSSDARRVAYVADRDGKKYAVIDGVAGKGYSSITNNFYMFSPDGKRTAYIAIVYGEKPPVGNKWFVVIDEEEVKEYDH
jgi:hypothetical protein